MEFYSIKALDTKDYLTSLSTNSETFLLKKRKAKKDPSIINCDEYKLYNDLFNVLEPENKTINFLQSTSDEQLANIPNNNEKKILTNLQTINHNELTINTKKNLNTTLDNILSQNINDKITLPNTLGEENNTNMNNAENNCNVCIKLDEEEKPKTTNNLILKNKNEKKLNIKKYTNPGLNKKEKICCIALDLLYDNGSYQIMNSKSGNIYLLKIRKIEIKDDYFEQIDYAKYYGKYSELKSTAPNYKFWMQRYYYFTKFDKGIQMDNESWYSVTPEKIAKYIATLIKGKTIIDGFCGCGGNVIQFSEYCSKAYAIDICEKKLSMCKNNCKIYNCKDNIEFIHSDFLQMKNKIKADYIFLSPPWGGTEYKKSSIYSIKKCMHPDITEIVRVSLNVADNILFFLPRNLDLDELFKICSDIRDEMEKNSGKKLFFDIQIIESNKRIKSLLIIFGKKAEDILKKSDLEDFLFKNYKHIEEKHLDYLYSVVKTKGYFTFFEEEKIYLTKKYKGRNISELVEYLKKKGY